MCLICVQWQNDRMSTSEVRSAIREMVVTKDYSIDHDHLIDLIRDIEDHEEEQAENSLP